MEKKVSFKKGENLVTLSLNSEKRCGLSTTIYKLKVYDRYELEESLHEMIEDDLNIYVDDLQNQSISELVAYEVDMIMDGCDDYLDSLYSEAKGDDLIQVEWFSTGQPVNDLLKMFPNSEPLKELAILCKQLRLAQNVNQSVVNRVVELLNQLDSGEDGYGLAENMVKDYIKKNY